MRHEQHQLIQKKPQVREGFYFYFYEGEAGENEDPGPAVPDDMSEAPDTTPANDPTMPQTLTPAEKAQADAEFDADAAAITAATGGSAATQEDDLDDPKDGTEVLDATSEELQGLMVYDGKSSNDDLGGIGGTGPLDIKKESVEEACRNRSTGRDCSSCIPAGSACGSDGDCCSRVCGLNVCR